LENSIRASSVRPRDKTNDSPGRRNDWAILTQKTIDRRPERGEIVDETRCLLQEEPFERAPAQAENRLEDELFRQARSSDPSPQLAR
jgi:hypothetical protein